MNIDALFKTLWEPGELVYGGPLKDNEKARQIYGDPMVLKKCRADKKFAYVVALATSGERLEFGAFVNDEYNWQRGHASGNP